MRFFLYPHFICIYTPLFKNCLSLPFRRKISSINSLGTSGSSIKRPQITQLTTCMNKICIISLILWLPLQKNRNIFTATSECAIRRHLFPTFRYGRQCVESTKEGPVHWRKAQISPGTGPRETAARTTDQRLRTKERTSRSLCRCPSMGRA